MFETCRRHYNLVTTFNLKSAHFFGSYYIDISHFSHQTCFGRYCGHLQGEILTEITIIFSFLSTYDETTNGICTSVFL